MICADGDGEDCAPALWTGLARIVFVLQYQAYAFRLGFVLDVGADCAMAPPADLLIGRLREIDAIGNVAHIPHDDGGCLAVLTGADLKLANLEGARNALLFDADTNEMTICPDGTAGPCQ